MLDFVCVGCRRKLRAPLSLSGKVILCPRCKTRVTIPADLPSLTPEQATLPPSADPDATMAPPSDADATLPPAEGSSPSDPGVAPPRVPGYEILDELGRGGMGVVYKARQIKLKRVVALKMILVGGHAGEQDLVRFRTEAEAVASLQHPNIVQVFEVNDVGGLPYFSLEFVDGGSLDRKLAGTPMKSREAAALVETLAIAMQEAHQKGIVHRDLKPANVLLASSGRESGGPHTPKITDFGLAKKLEGGGQTQTGSVMGTPSYMAPEQAGGRKDVGPPADIYALGAILYECLTGRPPFRASTALDTILQVISDDPIPPSRLNPKVPRDLETITLKCLQKDPARRYSSAQALAKDLRAYQEDRPITARPVGRIRQAWRWCKRNRAVAILLATVFLVLAAGVAVSTMLGLQARFSAIEAQENFRRADSSAKRAERSEKQTSELLYSTQIAMAHREWLDSTHFRARTRLEQFPVEQRGWEWNYLTRIFQGELFSLKGHALYVLDLAVSPTGDRVATTGVDRTARLWDPVTKEQIAELKPAPYRVTFSPDGRRIAGAVEQSVMIWDAVNGRQLSFAIPINREICGLQFVSGGKRLALLTVTGEVQFLDPDTGEELFRCPQRLTLDQMTKQLRHRGQFAVFSPDGSRVAQGGEECKVRVWDTATGTQLMTGIGHMAFVGQVAFSPDGKQLASPGGEGVRIWDVDTGKVMKQLYGHRSWIHAVAFSPDGTRLATGSKDTSAQVWDLASGQSIQTLNSHMSEVWRVEFGPDGKRLYTSSPDGEVKVWDTRVRVFVSKAVLDWFRKTKVQAFGDAGGQKAGSPETWTYYGHIGHVDGLALSPDGRLAATGAVANVKEGCEVRIWDLDTNREVRGLPVPVERRTLPAFSPDGKWLAVGSGGVNANATGEVRIFDVGTGEVKSTWKGFGCTHCKPVFSPDGKSLACAYSSMHGRSTLEVREVATGKVLFNQDRGSRLMGPFYVNDSEFLTGAGDGWVRLQDARTGKELRSWKAGETHISALALSSSGLVATMDTVGIYAMIRLWDLKSGQKLRDLKGHVGHGVHMAFNPDGTRLFSCATDFTNKVWDTSTGHELLTWREHRDIPLNLAWSHDGRRLASVGMDGALKVWDGGLAPNAPLTDQWKRLYRDEFDRTDLGAQWEPVNETTWTVQQGALRGDMKLIERGGTQFTYSDIRLKGVDLPRTVEVRFTVQVSGPMVVAPQLLDVRREQALCPVVAGRIPPFNFTGTVLFLIQGSDKLQFKKLGNVRQYSLSPGTPHQYRIVRTPERLWLYIDDVEIYSEEIPPLDSTELRLQGSWSEPTAESEIRFDNVEIRAPADAIRERQILNRLEKWVDQHGAVEPVKTLIDKEPTFNADERQQARILLTGVRPDPDRLLRQCMEVTNRKKATAQERQQALDQALAASRMVMRGETRLERMPPGAGIYLSAVGLARLRAGNPKLAFEELERAIPITRSQRGSATTGQMAAMALAAHAAGEVKKAKEYHRQMLDLIPGMPEDEKKLSQSWIDEANTALGKATAHIDEEPFKVLLRSDAVGWMEGDVAGYMALRTADFTEEIGREEKPGAYELVFDRKMVARLRPWNFKEVTKGTTYIRYENVEIDSKGDSAIVRYQATVRADRWFRTYQCVAHLRKEAGTWKIAKERSRPIRGVHRGRGYVFDDAWWQNRDGEADRLEGERKVQALLDAERHRDAFGLLKKLTTEPGATAELWTLRGNAALKVGDIEEAIQAYREVTRLDPEVAVHSALTRPTVVLKGHTGEVYGVAYHPNGELVTGGKDHILRRWSATGKLLRKDPNPENNILTLDVSRDGKRIITAGNNIYLWEQGEKQPRMIPSGHSKYIYRVAFDSQGNRLVTASADDTARIFDVKGALIHELRGHERDVLGAVFSPDGRWVATASRDRTVRLWDATTGKEVRKLRGHSGQVIRVGFSPDGKTLASCGQGGEVKIWNVNTGEGFYDLEIGNHDVEVVVFSPNGKYLAAGGSDGKVRLWETTTWKQVRTLTGLTQRVFTLVFSQDGSRLAAGSAEAVCIWELLGLP